MTDHAFHGIEAPQGSDPAYDLLMSGGDHRIALDHLGRNRYGLPLCAPQTPFGFSSTTASPLTPRGHREVLSVYEQLQRALQSGKNPHELHDSQVDQIRSEILAVLGIQTGGAAAPQCLLSPSGTDSHRDAAILLAKITERPLTFLMIEEPETGSGIREALASVASSCTTDVVQIAVRGPDGQPLQSSVIEGWLDRHIKDCVAGGSRAVLVLTDVSKTGCLWPDPRSVRRLKESWRTELEVIVDACQMRLSPAAVRRYLSDGFLVIITGSKFIGGPTFSGALLVPNEVRFALAQEPVRATARGRERINDDDEGPNFGLILRWRAALAEWRAFSSLDQLLVSRAMDRFARTLSMFIERTPQLDTLARPSWDDEDGADALTVSARRSIITVLIKDRAGAWMGRRDLADLHARLSSFEPAIYLGQPVTCGERDGSPVAALRLSLSAAPLIDRVDDGHIEALVQNAMIVLTSVLDARS